MVEKSGKCLQRVTNFECQWAWRPLVQRDRQRWRQNWHGSLPGWEWLALLQSARHPGCHLSSQLSRPGSVPHFHSHWGHNQKSTRQRQERDQSLIRSNKEEKGHLTFHAHTKLDASPLQWKYSSLGENIIFIYYNTVETTYLGWVKQKWQPTWTRFLHNKCLSLWQSEPAFMANSSKVDL